MTDLDALLAGIVADPANAVRWLVMADWLEDHGQPERAELVRVHRELLRTCTATRETKACKQLHARMMELMRAGVQPCLPQRTITLPGGVEMRFSFIPPGPFRIGPRKAEGGPNEFEPLRLAPIKQGYWMGQTPVTNLQWCSVMATGLEQRDADDLPVVRVSWNQAVEFCAVLRQRLEVQLRLPSDEEWEYAARSGTTTPFYWGKTSNGTESNCYGQHPYGTDEKGPGLLETSVVGSYAQVAPHPWNLVDLLGNVYEFCSDWMSTPAGISANKVVRGGTFRYNPEHCRCADRSSVPPDRRDYQNGFRVAADLSALA